MAGSRIVVLGAGLGGTLAAYEIAEAVKGKASVHVVSKGDDYWFVPSNPWVAVGWRQPEALRVHLPPVMARRGIGFNGSGAKRVDPEANRIELNDGTSMDYDYLVIATGPDLAWDEIEGFGPDRNTVSICETASAAMARAKFEELCANPRPIVVGAAQGASCYGPAYEMAMTLDTELKKRGIRHKVPMTFVTPEPYIGHLGLDGVGDTKGMLESEMRDRHIKWITNAKVDSVEDGTIHMVEVNEDGSEKKRHDLDFGWCMLMPPFRGVPAIMGLDGLVNPRGFVVVDKHQRNPRYANVFGLGVCIAIPPTGPTALPVGVPKTGFMIESMVTAVAQNLRQIVAGQEATHEATWNAVCLADFGDGGVAFVAKPQIPPRNVNWASEGKWVHLAKIGFEKYFLGKVRKGVSQPFTEKMALKALGLDKLLAQ
jgi:sulfide:quinone oxidoreductase